MSTLPNFLRSILLTGIFSFLAPVLLFGAILLGLSLLSYIPTIEILAQNAIAQVCYFLAIFGSSSPVRGVLIIGMACSLVGVLFDMFTFYRYQNLRDN